MYLATNDKEISLAGFFFQGEIAQHRDVTRVLAVNCRNSISPDLSILLCSANVSGNFFSF